MTAILQTETGLQQLMGDRALYLQILRRFRQRYHDAAGQARRALEAGDAVEAERIVHTLKGAAGMIGAQQTYLLAAAVEGACAGPADGCRAALAQLEQALRSLMMVVDTLLDSADDLASSELGAGTVTPGIPPPSTAMLMQHLARLLDEGDGTAIDVLERSATVLAASLGVEVFEEVTAAAHQFDFETALAVLLRAPA